MKKRILRGIINGFTVLMLFVFFLSIAMLDSETAFPIFTMLLSLGWLFVYAKAKGSVYMGGEDE